MFEKNRSDIPKLVQKWVKVGKLKIDYLTKQGPEFFSKAFAIIFSQLLMPCQNSKENKRENEKREGRKMGEKV